MSSIKNRKLKVYSALPGGVIAAFQDGSAADGEVTPGYLFNDAFRSGVMKSGNTLDEDRERLEIVSYTCDLESGGELVLRYTGRRAWLNDNGLAWIWSFNDRVAFSADVPDAIATATQLPSYHLNRQTQGTSVRWFHGHIVSVETDGTNGLIITCQDMRWRANRIKLQRDAQEGITIAKIAFNLPKDNPDAIYCIKLVDAVAGTVGTGVSKEMDDRATLKQILEYIRDTYDGALIAAGVLDPGQSGFLFTDADLAGFTHKPDAIVLEDVGLFDGVRAILETWAPEVKIWIDPRTTQWRLLPFAYGIKASGVGSVNSNWQIDPGPNYHNTVYIQGGGPWSATPGADGNRIRIYQSGNHAISQEFTIYEIVGTGVPGTQVRLKEPLIGGAFAGGSPVWPVFPQTFPNVVVSIDDCPLPPQIKQDADGVATAVNITSVYQKTSSYSLPWNRNSLGAGDIQPAWDATFEGIWKDDDRKRQFDAGHPNKEGLRAYRVGNNGTNDYLDVPYSASQYGNDHVSGEWNGCIVWIRTLNGLDVTATNRRYTVKSQTTIADVGDGTPGLRLILDVPVGTIGALPGPFTTIDFGSGIEDRFWLGSFFQVPVSSGAAAGSTGNNKRWEVGRMFKQTVTTVAYDNSASPHLGSCALPKIWDETGKRLLSQHPQQGYAANNQNVGWTYGGGYGQFGVFKRSFNMRTPVGRVAPGGVGWQPPQIVNVEYETTTTELRSARFPVSGFAGGAYARYGYEYQLDIPTHKWFRDDQTADYTSLAERLWLLVSGAHHSGTIVKPGAREWGALIDLGFRCSLTAGITQSLYQGPVGGATAPGYGSTLMGFWSAVTRVTIDFPQDQVTFGFNDLNITKDLALHLKERFARVENVAEDLEALRQKLNELPACMAGSEFGETPSFIQDSSVRGGDGRPGGPKGGQIPQAKSILGCAESAIGAAGTGGGLSSSATGGVYSTHGERATSTVWIDLAGNAYLTDPTGAQVPGTVTNQEFAATGAAYTPPVVLPTRAQDEIEAMFAAFLGITDLQHENPSIPIICRTKAGSTASALKIEYPTLPTIVSGDGCRVIVQNYADRKASKIFTVSSAGGDTITLTESIPAGQGGAPPTGIAVWVLAKLRPIPNPAHFLPGSVPFKVGSQWAVLQPDGKGFAATLNGGTNQLDKYTGSTVVIDLTAGITNGNGSVQFSVTPSSTWNMPGGEGGQVLVAEFYNQDATPQNTTRNGYGSIVGLNGALHVPTDKVMKILSAIGTVKTGPEDASYQVQLVVVTPSSTDELATESGGANTVLTPEEFGSLAAPLIELEGGTQWTIGWRNVSAGPNELDASHVHHVRITYVEVDP